MDLDFKCQIEEFGLDEEGSGEPWRVLEEGKSGSVISCRHDYVESCLKGVNRRQKPREEVCVVSSGDEEGRILLG